MKSGVQITIYVSVLLISHIQILKAQVTSEDTDDKLLMSVLWYQHSAEMTALYYQGFNIARQRLDEAVTSDTGSKPLAVVVDIDETMLDNSPFEASLINNEEDLAAWYNWTAKSSAKSLPGALEFTKYAQSRNVKIFYITNRDDNEREATLKNLRIEGFPDSSEINLLTKSDFSYSSGNTSSKAVRRAKVTETHTIILFIGDNLNDFSEIFEDRSKNNGKDAVIKNSELFGKKYVILPNPMYGAWEKSLFDYKEGLGNVEKKQLMKSKLRMD